MNYTYTEIEQRSGPGEGQRLIGTPEHMFNGNLRWSVDERFGL